MVIVWDSISFTLKCGIRTDFIYHRGTTIDSNRIPIGWANLMRNIKSNTNNSVCSSDAMLFIADCWMFKKKLKNKKDGKWCAAASREHIQNTIEFFFCSWCAHHMWWISGGREAILWNKFCFLWPLQVYRNTNFLQKHCKHWIKQRVIHIYSDQVYNGNKHAQQTTTWICIKIFAIKLFNFNRFAEKTEPNLFVCLLICFWFVLVHT